MSKEDIRYLDPGNAFYTYTAGIGMAPASISDAIEPEGARPAYVLGFAGHFAGTFGLPDQQITVVASWELMAQLAGIMKALVETEIPEERWLTWDRIAQAACTQATAVLEEIRPIAQPFREE